MGATLREAWLWLLLAFLLGLVVGYVLKTRAPREHMTAGSTTARILDLEAQLEECKSSAVAPAAVAAVAAASRVATSSSAIPATSAIPASRAASAAGASATLVAPKAKKASAATKTPSRKPAAKPVPLDLAAAKSAFGTTVKLDDLKFIEGISPKIEGLFKADGIVTWRDLSRSNVERLQGILGAAGPRYSIHNPGSWPKQAGLLADGKWADFKALNDKLKGGR